VTLEKTIPPAPVIVQLFIKDEICKRGQGMEILRWIPRFWIPENRSTEYRAWITAQLKTPLSGLDYVLQKFVHYVERWR
jgi:hypothetical protein